MHGLQLAPPLVPGPGCVPEPLENNLFPNAADAGSPDSILGIVLQEHAK